MKNKIECEKAVGEICEMCFKKHELEYGHQPIVHCDKCDFGGHCGGERLIWLASPYKKPPYKLSQFEYDLIQTYSYVHEGYTLSKFKRLIKLKDKGYFKCVDYDTKIQDILENCEVIGK